MYNYYTLLKPDNNIIFAEIQILAAACHEYHITRNVQKFFKTPPSLHMKLH